YSGVLIPTGGPHQQTHAPVWPIADLSPGAEQRRQYLGVRVGRRRPHYGRHAFPILVAQLRSGFQENIHYFGILIALGGDHQRSQAVLVPVRRSRSGTEGGPDLVRSTGLANLEEVLGEGIRAEREKHG